MSKKKTFAIIAGSATGVIAIMVATFMVFVTVVPLFIASIVGSASNDIVECEVTTGVEGSLIVGTGAAGAGGYKTPEEIAAIIYAQATGLGLGELGAVAAIATAAVETSDGNTIQNGTGSDTFPTSEIRGVFQQKVSWVPKGLAWSGLKWTRENSQRVFMAKNPITGKDDGANPWKITKWAVSDPRMNPAQGVNMFILGGQGGQEGLERVLLKKENGILSNRGISPAKSVNAADYSAAQIGAFGDDVQESGDKGRAATAVDNALDFVDRIKAGKIRVPAFQPPLPQIARLAQSTVVKNALKKQGVDANAAVGVASVSASLVKGDGVTFIGDAVMQGMLASQKLPETMFGGPISQFYARGVTANDVLVGDRFKLRGAKDAQGNRVSDMSTWRDAIATGPSRVVVALGSSGGLSRAQIDSFMALAGPGRDVYWYTTLFKGSKSMNGALVAATAAYPNLTVVDVTDVMVLNQSPVPWFGINTRDAKKLQSTLFNRSVELVTTERAPSSMTSVACGGESVFIGDINAPSAEAAAAVIWAVGKARAGAVYKDSGEAGTRDAADARGLSFDCSSFTYLAYLQAGYKWSFGTSSVQWADSKNIQLIPIADAAPGDLFWQNWGAGDGLASGHVGIIVSTEGEGKVVHAANPEKGVVIEPLKKNMKRADGQGVWMAPKNPNKRSSSASDVIYSENWKDAWVGRIISDNPNPSFSTVSPVFPAKPGANPLRDTSQPARLAA
jgi:cell wall-associated NlpC family hydrolase